MFAMFTQLFNTIRILFLAGEKSAGALNHLATWGEESAGSFADEARIKRQQRLNELMLETGVTITAGGLTAGDTTVTATKRIK
jgi:hypothetical protein